MEKLSFEKVYQDYKDDVWRWTSRFVFTKSDREDLFQDIFIRVYKALNSFRGEASIKTWIYRITLNTSINYLKKMKRQKTMRDILSNLRVIESQPGDNISEVELSNPLEKLNPRQRSILIMADVEEKKFEEISNIMGVPIGTIKSNLFRAREIVRKELIKNGQI